MNYQDYYPSDQIVIVVIMIVIITSVVFDIVPAALLMTKMRTIIVDTCTQVCPGSRKIIIRIRIMMMMTIIVDRHTG